MKPIKFLALTFLFFSGSVIGQDVHSEPHICGEHHAREKLINENYDYYIQDSIDHINNQASYESFMEDWSPYDRSTYIVPIVVHVVHINGVENISDDQIYNAIETLNEDFNMMNNDVNNTIAAFQGIVGNPSIEFRLATKDPQGNCHSGITRTLSTTTFDTGMGGGGHPIVDAVAAEHGIWPQNRYMSIFVCSDPSGNAGYTFRPSNFFAPNLMYGAIFMRHDYMGTIGTSMNSHRHTLSHEAGHWFDLAHLWGSTNNPGVASSCSTDDGIADTPVTIGWTSCNLSGTTCGTLDNVQNIMEYSYCSTMFTQGQAARIQSALTSSTAGRNNLSTNTNLAAAGVNVANDDICEARFITNTKTICAGSSVQFSDVSVHNVTGRNWTFSGGSPANSVDSTQDVTYNTPGEYTVVLEVYNSTNNETTTETNLIKVLPAVGEEIPFVEGFENQNNFPNNVDFSVENALADVTWEVENQYSSSGSKSVVLKNYNATVASVDALVSGTYDLSVLDPGDDFILSFKYAYHKRESSNDEWLRIYASKDCGETWTLRKSIHGNILGDQVESGYYTPDDSDWETVTITNISSSFYVPNFRYKFEFTSDLGNNIYIDDINLISPVFTDISVEEGNTGVSIYPNPTQNYSQLNLKGYTNETVLIELYDVTGNKVSELFAGQITNDSETVNMDTKDLSKGLYFVRIKGSKADQTLKLIKQ